MEKLHETLGSPLDFPSVPIVFQSFPIVTKCLPSYPTFKASTAPGPSGAQVSNILNNICNPVSVPSNF